jgi:hypothetical protein
LAQYGPRAPCFLRIFEKDFGKFEVGAHIFSVNISFEYSSGVCAAFFGIERCSKFRPQTTKTIIILFFPSKYLHRYWKKLFVISSANLVETSPYMSIWIDPIARC